MFPILNPPPSPYHPSGSSKCTSPKHPVSCIEPGLATRFIHDILHSNCFFLTCIQIFQEAGQAFWYSHLFQNFPQFVVNHIAKGLDIANKAEVDVFLELPCFLHDPTNVGNFISVSSTSLKPSLYIWKFSVHIFLKPNLKNFEHSLASI